MLGEERRARVGRTDGARAEPDAELVAAVASGDRAALGALYDLHAPIVLGVAKRMLREQAAAEDLVHDVFIEVWQHAASFSPERGTVRAWLLVRTRSRALDRLGRSARDARAMDEIALDVELDESMATPGIQATVDGARVQGLLAELPGDLRAVLDSAYFEGLSATECAQLLGVPVGTVKSRLARALHTLRRAIALPSERDS
ncbi:MAG TPA: sigma-70 family RNA polymerase sigma factor [Polyangia bacterium]